MNINTSYHNLHNFSSLNSSYYRDLEKQMKQQEAKQYQNPTRCMPNKEYFVLNQQQDCDEQKLQINGKFAYPVDLQKCQTHRKANLICKNVYNEPYIKTQYRKKCQCCGRIVGDDPQRQICYDPLQLAVYGPGIPLYFLFLEYIIKLLVLCLLVFGVYAFVTNINGSDCSKPKHCPNNSFIQKQSILNAFESDNIAQRQIHLLILLIVLLIPVFQLIRHKIKIEKLFSDSFLTSPSDFAVILRRLPEGTKQVDIMRMVNRRSSYLSPNEKIETQNLAIHKILFAHNLDQYQEVEQKNIDNFKEKKRKSEKFQMIPCPKIEQKLTTAILIFQRESSKRFFLKHINCLEGFKKFLWMGYRPLSSLVQIKDQHINIERAPQPDDIIWQNCGYSMEQLFVRKSGMVFLSFLVLTCGAYLHYQLAILRRRYEFDDHLIQQAFSLGSATLITLINFAIEYVLIWSSKFQKPDTKTLLKISLTTKIVMLQFINTGIIYVLIAGVVYLPDYRFYKSLICSDIAYIMGMNMIFNNIFTLVWVLTQLPNSLYRRSVRNNLDVYTQIEANKIHEAGIVELEYKYAYIFKTLWLTAFFIPTMPSVILISMAGLLINYWCQKFLFSGFYTIPEMFSARLSVAVLDLLNFTPLWLSLGCMFIHWVRANLNSSQIPYDIKIKLYLVLLIGFLNIILPFPTLIKKLCPGNFNVQASSSNYHELKKKFECTYQQTNPAYNGGIKYRPVMSNIQVLLVKSLLNNPKSAFFKGSYLNLPNLPNLPILPV